MEIVIAGGVVALGLVVAAALLGKRTPAPSVAGGQAKVPPSPAHAHARGAQRRRRRRGDPRRGAAEGPRAGDRDARGQARRAGAEAGRKGEPDHRPSRTGGPPARAHVRIAGLEGEGDADEGARGPGAARVRPPAARGRGGDQARRRAPRPQHPLRGDAAARRRPRRRDHRQRRPAPGRRHEGPHHRPRGSQHPRPRAPHRRRLHHRRHAERRDPLGLRRRPPRDRPPHAREAAPGRPHPPGADRGDLLPGQVRAREPHRRVRRAGVLRRQRPGPRRRAHEDRSAGSSTAPRTARTCSRTRSSAPTWRR